jgi:hypothetical protein
MQNIIQTTSLVNISIAENDFSMPRKLSNIPAIRSIRSQLSSSARFRGCRGATAGKRYLAPAMRRHHQTHVELGEVVRGDESIISSAEGSLPSSQLSLFWSILEHSSMDLTETGDGCNDDDMSIEGDCDEADEEDETLAPWEEQNSIEASPEERRRQIHESNTAKWCKLSLLIEILQKTNSKFPE